MEKKTLMDKIFSFFSLETIVGFFLGIIAFISSLLFISERKRKKLETQNTLNEIKNIENEAQNEIYKKSLSDVISEHNSERIKRHRDN